MIGRVWWVYVYASVRKIQSVNVCVIYVWSILSWVAMGSDKELMQSAHPSSWDCFTVSTGLAGLDVNTRSTWHKKQDRPHRGNKHQSINTVVLLWGESCCWPSLPMTLLSNRRWGVRGFCLQTHPAKPRCCRNVFFSFVSPWCLFTPHGCLKACWQISSSPLQIWQTMGNKLPNPQTHKRRGFSNLSRSVNEVQQACSRQHIASSPQLCSINYTVVTDVNKNKIINEDPTKTFIHNCIS